MFSDGNKLLLFRLMQVVLLIILVIGVYQRNLSIIVNATVSLSITFLPAYLARNHNIAMSPGIILWITAAVFLHAIGTLGLYRLDSWSLFGIPLGWDSITHTLSASIVAGVGYATIRAIDVYDENIYLPRRFMFLFILLFVMAFGVFWELLEFGISEVSTVLNMDTVLTQYSLQDTIKDLMFNTLGGTIFALLGTARVQHVITSIHDELVETQ